MSFNLVNNSFGSIKDAEYSNKTRQNTNDRYSRFNQYYFTAGDKNQFMTNIDYTPLMGQSTISLEQNKFSETPILENFSWEAYKSITPDCLSNTFDYIFNNYKKGIFVSIRNNKVVTFLPFSNANFKNNWHESIQFNIKDVYKCISKACSVEGRKYNQKSVNRHIDQWYSNNALVRYEFPICEGDAGVQQIADMLVTLCNNRTIPDVDFFVNKRDFPLIKYTEQEAYDAIDCNQFDRNENHDDKKYMPILSMTTTITHADIPIPTWEDWTRIASQEDGKFFSKPIRDYRYKFEKTWSKKVPTAIFRGSSTGIGTTISTNMRLKIADLSHKLANPNFLDAGITKWNMRPRLSIDPKTKKLNIHTIDTDSFEFNLVDEKSPEEQSKYRYIINIDGHSSAYRLALELSMGSVILKVDSKYSLWFSRYLKPWTHYIPVASDLSDLIEKIEWAHKHDEECQKIANNALEFYNHYLCKDGMFDYLQWLLVTITEVSGTPYINYQKECINRIKPTQFVNVPKNILDTFDPHVNLFLPDNITTSVFDTLFRIFNYYSAQYDGKTDVMSYISKFFDSNVMIQNTKNNMISTHKVKQHDKLILSKFLQTNDHEKIQELIYSYNVGITLNKMLTFSDNFAYTLGFFERHCQESTLSINEYCILQQNIDGIAFLKWLESDDFNFTDYYCIMLQIALTLHTAYSTCGFIHNDLCPWNIILKQYKQNVDICYKYCGKQFSFTTKIVPVIIDYGKSNILIDNYYYQHNKKAIELQDIITLMITSAHTILCKQHVRQHDISKFIKFMNIIANEKYTNFKNFKSLSNIKTFTFLAKKYDHLINSNKGNLVNKSVNYFINEMLLNFFDDFYLANRSYCSPVINIDSIIIVDSNTTMQPYELFLHNIATKLELFLKKDIQFTKETNGLQFTKYYQNAYRSIVYLEELATNCINKITPNTIPDTLTETKIKQKYDDITRMISCSKEKLCDSWNKLSSQYLKIKKLVQVCVMYPIFANITDAIDLTNIDKAYTLLSKYDFSVYNKIKYNKLLLQTFEECQYFEKLPNNLFTLPPSIKKYYNKILVLSESSGLLTDSSMHDKYSETSKIEPEDYCIMAQYIGIIRDKTALKQFVIQLENYKNNLQASRNKLVSDNKTISFTYNEKLFEFGDMVHDIIKKYNLV